MPTSHPLVTRSAQELMEPFLAGYWSQRTRTNYAFILAGYLQWCTAQRLDALRDIAPGVVESWIAALRGRGYAPNTIAGRVSAVSAFYRWCVREQLIDRNPIDAIRRPARPTVSTTISLTRHELTDWLGRRRAARWRVVGRRNAAGLERAAASSSPCDITDVGSHSWHHTLALRTTKGDRPTVVALAPPTMQAFDAAIHGRRDGPLLLNRAGRRMTTYNVQYMVAAVVLDAGIGKRLTPHGLRHSAITIGLDAGVSLRDMQDFARHADPKTIRRYDRARHALNRHATYAIARYLAGGT